MVFYVQNSHTVDIDTLILEKTGIYALDRWAAPHCKRFGKSVWEHDWDLILNFFHWVGHHILGGSSGNSGNQGNSGSWMGSGIWAGVVSGLGSWSPPIGGSSWGSGGNGSNGSSGNSGTTGGNGNQQYLDPHDLSKARCRINESYGINWDAETMQHIFGSDCLLAVASLNLPANNCIMESECVEYALANSIEARILFISRFLEENKLDIPFPDLMAIATNSCSPAMGYPAFKGCMLLAIVNNYLVSPFNLSSTEITDLVDNPTLVSNYLDWLTDMNNISFGQFIYPDPQATLFASTSDPLCIKMFEFTYLTGSTTEQTAGLKNLSLQLSLANGPEIFTIKNLYFETGSTGGNCGDFEEKATNAVNLSMVSTAGRIDAGLLAGTSNMSLEDRKKRTLLSEMFKNFHNQVNICAPHYSQIKTNCMFIDNSSATQHISDDGTIFIDFKTKFDPLCH